MHKRDFLAAALGAAALPSSAQAPRPAAGPGLRSPALLTVTGAIGKPNRGPLLVDVLKAAGAATEGKLAMRAVDGYAPTVSIADARKYRFIVATHLDGQTMPLGGVPRRRAGLKAGAAVRARPARSRPSTAPAARSGRQSAPARRSCGGNGRWRAAGSARSRGWPRA